MKNPMKTHREKQATDARGRIDELLDLLNSTAVHQYRKLRLSLLAAEYDRAGRNMSRETARCYATMASLARTLAEGEKWFGAGQPGWFVKGCSAAERDAWNRYLRCTDRAERADLLVEVHSAALPRLGSQAAALLLTIAATERAVASGSLQGGTGHGESSLAAMVETETACTLPIERP